MSDCAQLSSCMHEKLASPNRVIVISKWNFLRSSLSAFLFLKGSTIIYIWGEKLMANLIFWGTGPPTITCSLWTEGISAFSFAIQKQNE